MCLPKFIMSFLTVDIILCLLLYVDAWGRGDLEKYGPLQMALKSGLIKCNHEKTMDLDVCEVYVYFYDFSRNVNMISKIDTAATEILSKIDNKVKKIIVFVPGFKSSIRKKTAEMIRNTFRKFPHAYLMIIDHSAYTHNDEGFIKSYERSVSYVYYIGKKIAQMLKELNEGGISPKRVHCVGHSLGGQILGYTGQTFLETTGEKLFRITALDPAGPCFSNSLIEDQVRSGLAEYVEVYHCNAGGFGSSSVLGDVDFFFNKKGHTQPKCKTPIIPGVMTSINSGKCNHNSCIDFWMATVNRPEWFPALKCDTYKKFKKGHCSGNEMTTAGFWNPGVATGVYYISTKDYDIP